MKYLLYILLFSIQHVGAQNLSGKWVGEQLGPEYRELVDISIIDGRRVEKYATIIEKYKLEMNLVQSGDRLTGTSLYRDMNSRHWVQHRISGSINGNEITISEDEVIADAGRSSFYFGTIRGNLVIDSVNKKLVIKGMIFHHKLFDHISRTATNEKSDAGGIRITKPYEETPEAPVATVSGGKVPDPGAVPALPPISKLPVDEFTQRKKLVVHTFDVTTDSLSLQFYDDSDIDDDTITVYYNNNIIISKQRLTDKPLIINIHIPPGTDNEMVMFANNVGSIPPNTALLIFYDNGVRKEIKIDSDTRKSGAVIFRRKK